MRKPWLILAVSAFTALGLLAVPSPGSAADPQPAAVSVPGSFGAQVGCPGDWQPDCAQLQLTRRSNDDVWSTTLTLKAGNYEYKAALNKTWDVDNLYLTDGSVFASKAHKNPTLTIMALSMRASDHIASRLRKGEI